MYTVLYLYNTPIRIAAAEPILLMLFRTVGRLTVGRSITVSCS